MSLCLSLSLRVLCFKFLIKAHDHIKYLVQVIVISLLVFFFICIIMVRMLADDTKLHTSGKNIMQVEHTLKENLDQISC